MTRAQRADPEQRAALASTADPLIDRADGTTLPTGNRVSRVLAGSGLAV
jgi:hypothetical protein